MIVEININSRFLKLEFEETSKTLISIWETVNDLREDDYKKLFLKYVNAVEKTKPQNLLINAVNAHYPISVDTQKWINGIVLPIYKKLKIKKMAIVMSEDFIAQLSFEQVAEEIELPNFDISYFVSREKALQWISS